jgi:hypothetical protein
VKIVTLVPITKGVWESTNSPDWTPMYFMECLLDWSMFRGCKGKLYVETMENAEEGGWLRLGYQQVPAKWVHIEDSEIDTEDKPPQQSARWALLESQWFDLPKDPGVSCLWILCKARPKKRCSVALATLVIAEPEWDEPIVVQRPTVYPSPADPQTLPTLPGTKFGEEVKSREETGQPTVFPEIVSDPMDAHRSKEELDERKIIYAGPRVAKNIELPVSDNIVQDLKDALEEAEKEIKKKKGEEKLTTQDEDIDPWRPQY